MVERRFFAAALPGVGLFRCNTCHYWLRYDFYLAIHFYDVNGQAERFVMRDILIRHQNVICLTILILIPVGLWLPRLQGPLDLRTDGGVYYILGSSPAQGKGYRLLNEPGEIQAVKYPPYCH